MTVYAIVPVAGSGSRFGGSLPKQFIELDGQPLIIHTLKIILANPAIRGVVLVCAKDQLSRAGSILEAYPEIQSKVKMTTGGKTRQDSVGNGIKLVPENTDLILVHDGVRPLLTAKILDESIAAAEQYGAAIVAVPAKDTIKIVVQNRVQETPDRNQLMMVQTPQVARTEWLKKAHKKAAEKQFQTTDEAALLEWADYPVHVVTGEYTNIKITTSDDLIFAEAILKRGQ